MPRILVAYATQSGVNIDVAETIGDTLREQGASVDVLKMGEIRSLEGYDGFVVGSSIREQAWLPDAITFLEAHRSRLAEASVAYYTLCMTLERDTPESREEVESYLAAVRERFPEIVPVDEMSFAGALTYSRLDTPDLKIVLERAAQGHHPFTQGDFRDWDAIRAWAQGIYPLLTRR